MIARICAVAIMTAIVGTLLAELGFRSRRLFSLLALVILFSALSESIADIIGRLTELSSVGKISDAVNCTVKIVGVGYVYGISSDVCSELGESTLAKGVTLAGRIEILVVAFPFFEKTIKLGLELLQ